MSTQKKFTYSLATIVIVALGAALAYFFFNPRAESPVPARAIKNFEECAAAGYPVGESYPRQCWTPDGKHFVEELNDTQPQGPEALTINGTIDCLPKKGSGPQTLECAIGLRDLSGKYYELRNLSTSDPDYKYSTGGLKVEVTGLFSTEEISAPDANSYDVIGVIDVTSIKEVAQ